MFTSITDQCVTWISASLTFPGRCRSWTNPSSGYRPIPLYRENAHARLHAALLSPLQWQQVRCRWSIHSLNVSIRGEDVKLILRAGERLSLLALWPLPDSCRTPSSRQQRVEHWRWRFHKRADTSAAPVDTHWTFVNTLTWCSYRYETLDVMTYVSTFAQQSPLWAYFMSISEVQNITGQAFNMFVRIQGHSLERNTSCTNIFLVDKKNSARLLLYFTIKAVWKKEEWYFHSEKNITLWISPNKK